MPTCSPIVLFTMTLVLASANNAQEFLWSRLTPASGPDRAWLAGWSYDEARDELVLFGGNFFATTYGDTWTWNGSCWTLRSPATSPPERFSHCMAYDAARQAVVVFGGYNLGPYFNDTWTWDGSTWTMQTPAAQPGARTMGAMAYDAARQRVVLFGGSSAQGAGADLGDTWEWHGSNWLQRQPAQSPGPREGHEMTYDVARQRVVLFGGIHNTTLLPETWEWDGTNWLQRTPLASPPARMNFAMAYDQESRCTVLFGGSGSQGGLSDTWQWDGSNWVERKLTLPPPPLWAPELCYDSGRRRLTMFGGGTAGTWVGRSAKLSARAERYGTGCGPANMNFAPDAEARPILGLVGSAILHHAPTYIAGIVIGFSKQSVGGAALPLSLTNLGMPGCDLLSSADLTGFVMTPVATSTLQFETALPFAVNLIGSHLYLQAFVIDPGENALQLIASNGIDWVLGDN